MNLLLNMNIIVSIVQPTFQQKATLAYEKRIMDILTSLQYKPLSNINRSEKWGKKNTNREL